VKAARLSIYWLTPAAGRLDDLRECLTAGTLPCPATASITQQINYDQASQDAQAA
jgi:hypothetical protein